MSVEYVLLLMFASLFVLLIMGLPIAFVLAFLGIAFGLGFWEAGNIEQVGYIITSNIWGVMKNCRDIFFESFETVKCGPMTYVDTI